MSALQDRRVRLLASLYATFGEAASWAGAPCTVRRRTETVSVDFGDSAGLTASNLLKVRAAEIAAPARGNTVVVTLAGGGTSTLRVIADPVLVKSGLEWVAEVAV